MKETIRMQRLQQIAEQDSIYQVWEKAIMISPINFIKLQDGVPKESAISFAVMLSVDG